MNMHAMPLAAWSDKLVKSELKVVEPLARKHPKGDFIFANAPKQLRPRLEYMLGVVDDMAQIEAEQRKYKDGQLPVTVREFITSPKYMDKGSVVWPKVVDEIEEACSGEYIEGVFTGGIGCAKSTAALYIQAYLLYLLSRMKSPHEEFGLDPASEIMIIFQSLNAGVAKTVEFERFKEMIVGAPYFQRHFQYDRSLKDSMHFPHRIIVKPVSGSDTAAIGQNVISAIIDEVNFMAVVEKSKKAADGGAYNQAIELYNSIVRRRESRYMQAGKVWGLLCLVSSARYPGQFTDKRKEAAKRQLAEEGKTNIFVYDKRAWEVMDPNSKSYSYTGKTFRLFLGDATRKPRIMTDGDSVALSDRHLVMEVPVEHRHAFQDDIYDAIRDVAGMATLATHPFIPYPEKVAECFGTVPSVLSREDCDFADSRVAIYPKRFENLEAPRFIHCDYSIAGDSTGVAIGHVTGFKWVERAENEKELLPLIRYDALLEVRPPKGGEIDFSKIRGLLYKLKELGLPLRWVSFDTYNSHDSILTLRQKGFITGITSLDVTPVPYEILKQAILDGRVQAPEHAKCQYELVTLERNPQNGKIDHTEVSSKDVSDCMAGVAYGLTMRREIWMMHGIDPQAIPKSVQDAHIQNKNSVEGGMGSAG